MQHGWRHYISIPPRERFGYYSLERVGGLQAGLKGLWGTGRGSRRAGGVSAGWKAGEGRSGLGLGLGLGPGRAGAPGEIVIG